MRRRKILFLEGNRDGTVGGSYLLMYDLVLGLDRQVYEPVVAFYTDNFLVPRLRDKGIETLIFDYPASFEFGNDMINKLLSPVKKLLNLYIKLVAPSFRFARFLRENEFDLVNLNNSIRANHPWMIAARLAGIPCMTHEMGINQRFTPVARFLGRRLNAIICLSQAIHDEMKKAGADFPNTEVIHSGIDLSRYTLRETPAELRQKFQIPEDAPIVGVVGNVKWWKGQETIVKAMPALVRKYPEIRCMLVGDLPEYANDYHQSLRDFIAENGIEKNVIFTGFQQNSIDFMNLMDVVAHTSVEPEPFGIVTLEAMSLKKPLVSTTIGGPAEVVVNGESGILIDPGKPELLSEALDSLLSSPERAREIGEAGYVNLQQNFTFEKCLKGTLKVYDRIFSGRIPKNRLTQITDSE